MAAQPPQLPDFAVLNTAAIALSQDAKNIAIHQRSFAQHQETLSQQIGFIQNVGAPPHLQALTDAIIQLTEKSTRTDARLDNMTDAIIRLAQETAHTDGKLAEYAARTDARLNDMMDAINRLAKQAAHTDGKLAEYATRSDARYQNTMAYISNSRVTEATFPLHPLRALQGSQNFEIGDIIPDFPDTPAALMALNRSSCVHILEALDITPVAGNDTQARIELGRAIGLSHFWR